jgi:hypothetical protein
VNTCDKLFKKKTYFPIFLNVVVSNILARLLRFTVFKNSKKVVAKWQNVQKESKNVDQYVTYHYG